MKLTAIFSVALAVSVFLLCPAAEVGWAQRGGGFEIRARSTRPETVSGGDVLVQIKTPAATTADRLSVTLNGREVAPVFRPVTQPNTWLGLVRDLQLGKNQLAAGMRGQRAAAQLTLVSHSISGPVISGPQQMPFICETEPLGLGAALDANCTVNTKVEYFYRSSAAPATFGTPNAVAAPEFVPQGRGGAPNAATALGTPGGNQPPPNPFKPFDPSGPRPTDLAQTTTTEGRAVPYIVRREMGTINRAVYVIAFLHEPGQPLPDPWTTPSSSTWNGRLLYSFGGGCGAGYRQGRTIGGLNANRSHLEDSQIADYALAKGYAVAGASLNVFGTSCADLISAETLMMVKERFVEQFGVPRYTIGSGRSGGSMQQHLIGNNYPGLLDGIIPTASFADTITFLQPLFDCELLGNALKTSTLGWTQEQKIAVTGHSVYEYCIQNGTRYPNLKAATNYDEKIVPPAHVYNAATNPKGARFTYQDNMVNVFGRDPRTGFARRPFDNVGVQYGLVALNEGKISVEQFLDLNSRVGGHDIDGHVIAQRTVADPDAVRAAHQTGRINDASQGLSAIPIIDVRPYTDKTPDVHDIVANHITRARLIAANGHANNHVFRTYAPGTQIQMAQRTNLDFMDQWLSNIARDTAAARTPLEKVVRNRPRDLADTCFTASGEVITDPARCREIFPVYSQPRMAAGAPMTSDRMKCELKPIDRRDYKQPITDAQLASLRTAFPQGVCDYSKKGVGQQAPRTWLSYPQTPSTTN